MRKHVVLIFSLYLIHLTLFAQESDKLQFEVFYDSSQFYWQTDTRRAIQLLEKAEEHAVTDIGIYHENYLAITNDLGIAYWKSGDFEQAEKALVRTLALKEEIYHVGHPEIFQSACNLAGFYADKRDEKQSKDIYRKYLLTHQEKLPAETFLLCLENLLTLYDLHQTADTALQYAEDLQMRQYPFASSAIDYRFKLFKAHVLRKQKSYEISLQELGLLLNQSANWTEGELLEIRVRVLQEAAAAHIETGSFHKAEKLLLTAYRILKTKSLPTLYLVDVVNSLGLVYDKLNIYDKAVIYYRESWDLCSGTRQSVQARLTIQSNVAGIQMKQGDVLNALFAYQEIVKTLSADKDTSPYLYVNTLNNLATCHRLIRQYDHAQECLETAQHAIAKYNLINHDIDATVKLNIGVLLTAQGEYGNALQYFEAAHHIRKNLFGQHGILLREVLGHLATINWALKQPEKGIPLLKESIRLSERYIRYIFPSLSEREQVQFYRNLQEDFERYNTFALQWHQYDTQLITLMLENQLLLKSLMFFENQKRAELISRSKDSTLVAQFEHLKMKREQLGHLYQISVSNLSVYGVTPEILEGEIDHLEKEISLKLEHIIEKDTLMTWQSLQSTLPDGKAALEIIRFRKYDLRYQPSLGKKVFGFTDSVYYAALITTSKTTTTPDFVLLKNGNDLENRNKNYYKNTLYYGVQDDLSFNAYWKPIAARLKSCSTVYVSPDGVFHKINFNTLRNPESNRYVIQDYDIIRVLNSLQVAEAPSAETTGQKSITLLGDPATSHRAAEKGFGALPGSLQEVMTIQKLLAAKAWSTKMFIKTAASESTLRKNSSSAVLHIASHGFFSANVLAVKETEDDFLFHSGLVLSANDNDSQVPENDGVLTAYEVMNLNLNKADLIVLSSCETGLGKIETSEGVYGLQRSFLQAGANNLILSLWKVEDNATRDLIIEFYKNLTDGQSFHNALKQAQLTQMEKAKDPFLWGAFTLISNN